MALKTTTKLLAIEARDRKCQHFEHKRYFVLIIEGVYSVLPAHCPHRGGPLQLAEWEETENGAGNSLICPWHHLKLSKKRLGKMALPAVKIEDHMLLLITGVFALQ